MAIIFAWCFVFAWPIFAFIPNHIPRRTRFNLQLEASSLLEANKDFETDGKPRWAGGGFISDLTSALIASPLFKVINLGARNVIIDGAINTGIKWNERKDELALQQNLLDKFYQEVEDKSVVYPSYYTQVQYLI